MMSHDTTTTMTTTHGQRIDLVEREGSMSWGRFRVTHRYPLAVDITMDTAAERIPIADMLNRSARAALMLSGLINMLNRNASCTTSSERGLRQWPHNWNRLQTWRP
jgi:hypothetical protein